MKALELDNKRMRIITTAGNLLIEGGPGSGKTTIALLKASRISEDGQIKTGQKILFLSFARATISRIAEHAKAMLQRETMKDIEINTYHGFTWEIIRSFGYLTCSKRTISLVTPPDAAALIAKNRAIDRDTFQKQLYKQDGRLCFDLFATVAADILEGSSRICKILSDKYPVILVDEFQDTNAEEWKLIKLLGQCSTIIALADLRQRIYDFRGASITRIVEFNEHFTISKFDLGFENHRSGDTDIAVFGDELLTGRNKGKTYQQVIINSYKRNYQDTYAPLKYELLNSIRRLNAIRPEKKWSIAILVRGKLSTLNISSALSQRSGNIPPISHEVLIDPAGPSLAAKMIATLLEPVVSDVDCQNRILENLIDHIRGRKNEKPAQADLTYALALEAFLFNGKLKGSTRLELLAQVDSLIQKRKLIEFSGSPGDDWLKIRKLFEDCTHERLKDIYFDALYLRLLNKGALLSEELSEKWRSQGDYRGAAGIIDSALLQEHFSMAQRNWDGIFVMTIHKSKGKEFDEVLIWEDEYRRILPDNANATDIERTKLALRVAVTRAKKRTTILTPNVKPCLLL